MVKWKISLRSFPFVFSALYTHNYTLDYDTIDFVKFTAHQKEDLIHRCRRQSIDRLLNCSCDWGQVFVFWTNLQLSVFINLTFSAAPGKEYPVTFLPISEQHSPS